MDIRQEKFRTEQANRRSKNIDTLSTKAMVKIINQEDKKVQRAIKKVLPQVAKVVDLIWTKFQTQGRLIYIGAGSSGRIGTLDASEIDATFGVGHNKIISIIAGGKDAIFKTQSGAEDQQVLAMEDLQNIQLNANDIVLGICASGKTPYVIGALEYAQKIGALSIGLCMNWDHALGTVAKQVIVLDTGPEVISGSTRMKAGSATKMLLNMISTTLMIKLGKVYQNYMIDLYVSNQKLQQRAFNIVQTITGASTNDVHQALAASNNSCRHAIVMLKKHLNFDESQDLLQKFHNNIRQIIG